MPKMKQDSVVRFEAINASDSYCNKEAFRRLFDFYSWDAESWFQTPTGKKSKTYKKSPFIEDTDNRGFYWFPTGMVPGMVDLCIKHKIHMECPNMGFTVNSTFPEEGGLNIKFRPNQIAAIKSAVQKGRGVIHASTGSGKTGVAFGIFQAYLQQDPKIQCLFLAHTVDLVHQAAKEFTEFGEKSVGIIQGQIRGEGRIICSTIQTMDKLGPEYYQNRFTVIIADECHRCAAFDSRYMRVMQNSFSPSRFGVTATLPNKPEGKIALEAAIGPVVDSFTINDGIEMGILSKPKIIFVPYKGSLFSGEMKTYRDIYEKNIVQSVSRNNKIAKLAKTFSDKGESSLIFVRQVDHGNRISEILKKLGVEHLWVSGVSEKEERMRTKEALEDKNIKVVICSTIWNEGISIKSLNNCILAAGGKDEKMVLQVVGRGTRVTETKKTVKIWDFLDPQKYLSQHCIERMIVYREQGWQVSILKKKIGV